MTTPEKIAVLLVEDDEEDYIITRDLLARQERVRYEVEWCSEFDAALKIDRSFVASLGDRVSRAWSSA